jgi:hypothetical protein
MLAVYDDPSNQHSIVILPRVAASQLDLTVQREKMVLGKDLLDATLFVTVLEYLCFFGCVLLRDETVRSFSWAIKVVIEELISVCIIWFFIQLVLWPLGFFSKIIPVLLICDMTSFFIEDCIALKNNALSRIY